MTVKREYTVKQAPCFLNPNIKIGTFNKTKNKDNVKNSGVI